MSRADHAGNEHQFPDPYISSQALVLVVMAYPLLFFRDPLNFNIIMEKTKMETRYFLIAHMGAGFVSKNHSKLLNLEKMLSEQLKKATQSL